MNKLRDRLAHKLANFALERLATDGYRDMLGITFHYGLMSASERLDNPKVADLCYQMAHTTGPIPTCFYLEEGERLELINWDRDQ